MMCLLAVSLACSMSGLAQQKVPRSVPPYEPPTPVIPRPTPPRPTPPPKRKPSPPEQEPGRGDIAFPRATVFVKYGNLSHSFAASLRTGGYTFTPGPAVTWSNHRQGSYQDAYFFQIDYGNGDIRQTGVVYSGNSVVVWNQEGLFIRVN